MNQRLRVYISSTFSDLAEYRAAVAEVLLQSGLQPVLLEQFPPDQLPLKAILKTIDECDIVILLLAHRLGYTPPNGPTPLVEREYDHARTANKPILVYLLDESAPWPPNKIDTDLTAVRRFREQLLRQHTVSFFSNPAELAARVAVDISRFSRHVQAVGIVPTQSTDYADDAGAITLAHVVKELEALKVEMTVLHQTFGDSLRLRLAEPGQSIPKAAEFLGPPAVIADGSICFVIMPYSQAWSAAVERIILEVCTQTELEFQIAKNMGGRFIPHDIWRGITGAGVIVADLSGGNPNVAYEIGLADVLGKEVILISQQDSVPFDFLAQRLVMYEDSLAGTLRLREELTSRLERYKARVALESGTSTHDSAG